MPNWRVVAQEALGKTVRRRSVYRQASRAVLTPFGGEDQRRQQRQVQKG